MNNKKAFTLIELLVVVLIIGILSAIALPQYQKAVIKSRFAETMINLKTISEADDVCHLETGEEYCAMKDLGVSIGEQSAWEGCSTAEGGVFETDKFFYCASWSVAGYPSAQYKNEDICLCYHDNQVFLGESAGCWGEDPSMNYASLLNIPEDSNCSCC
ncbi:MAG: prepilin-type N-terminal cleavage/methylation domain-containing protein [Elusimicrobiaceae bacterium]|nr:prepilin-type N-terminal cleavage/methylation domain-containing protein [Elusimicrobiaceae bacterium]